MLNSKSRKLIIVAAILVIMMVIGFGLFYWYLGRKTEDKNTTEYQKYQTIKKEETQKVDADKANILPAGNGEETKTLTPLPEGAKALPPLPN